MQRARTLRVALALAFLAAAPHAVHAQSNQLPSWGDDFAEQPKPARTEAPDQESGGDEPEESAASSAPVAAPAPRLTGLSPSDAQLRGADMDLERWDKELYEVQRETRLYLGGWSVLQTGLIAFNVYTAKTADDEARRTAFTVATALSAANFGYLIIQGWPALGSHKRFREKPSSTLQEKVAKATYAQEVIRDQRNMDRMAATIERHIGAFVVGIGAGTTIGLVYDNLYEALSLGVGIIGVAELMILSRPGNYHSPERRPTFALQNINVSPWADKHARGIGLSARF